jgi:TctA family transporter
LAIAAVAPMLPEPLASWPHAFGAASGKLCSTLRPPEYFALLLLGLLALAYMSGGSIPSSPGHGNVGTPPGYDRHRSYDGIFRFSYGLVELGDGMGRPGPVGLFGLSEILLTAGQHST